MAPPSKAVEGGMKWVRLYTDLPRHEKILRLMASPKGREAVGVYTFALAWSGDQRTDGYIPDYALPAMHAAQAHVSLLESVGLWDRNGSGWHIHNWEQRQDSQADLMESKRRKAQGGRRAACARYQAEGKHPKGCECWKEDQQ